MKLAAYFIVFETLACMGCLAQAKKAEASVASSRPKLEQMPESLEIRFALRAAPPHLRDAATTYVLDPAKGYVLSHKGTNGVTCIVVRRASLMDRPAGNRLGGRGLRSRSRI